MKTSLFSLLVLVATAGTAFAEIWPTDSVLRICNNTTDKTLQSSYTLQTTTGWQSYGWFELKPQACKRFGLGAYKGKTYLYAEFNHGEIYWGKGPVNFCVNKTSNFTIDNTLDANKCDENINQKMVPAFEFNIIAGTNTFTFNP